MYVRVKRQKVTIFLQTETWESVLEVKSKLQKHLDKVRVYLITLWIVCTVLHLIVLLQDPLDMKLVHVPTGQELEDSRTLSDLKVQNDEVLGLCFKKDTSAGTSLMQGSSQASTVMGFTCAVAR